MQVGFINSLGCCPVASLMHLAGVHLSHSTEVHVTDVLFKRLMSHDPNLCCLPQYPVRHGIVEDWDLMEKFLEQCIFKYLRAEPEDHYFLLTEPPFNTPENREYTAGEC